MFSFAENSKVFLEKIILGCYDTKSRVLKINAPSIRSELGGCLVPGEYGFHRKDVHFSITAFSGIKVDILNLSI
jgi:hypothetical protein